MSYTPLTVGELKSLIADLPDDTLVEYESSGWVDGYYRSRPFTPYAQSDPYIQTMYRSTKWPQSGERDDLGDAFLFLHGHTERKFLVLGRHV